MPSYFKSEKTKIAPRTLLTKNSWYVYGKSSNYEKIIFQESGAALISINSNVINGKWDYLNNAKSLLIDFQGNKSIYKYIYHDRKVIVFVIDGTELKKFYLVNEDLLSHDEVQEYILNMEHLLSYGNDIQKFVKLSNDFDLVIRSNGAKKLYKKGQLIINGEYFVGKSMFSIYDAQIVKERLFHSYSNGIKIWQDLNIPKRGDKVEGKSDKKFEITTKYGAKFIIKVNENGYITSAHNKKMLLWSLIIFLILVTSFILLL